jgi:hypothetical protein
MQGFLYKRGRGILPRYSKRLFCVSGTDLRYKLEVSDELWATTVSLSGAIITRGAAGRGRFHFELATTVRLFTLYATTSEERQAWIKALRLAGCGEGPPLTRDEDRESSARAPPSPANPPILIQAIDPIPTPTNSGGDSQLERKLSAQLSPSEQPTVFRDTGVSKGRPLGMMQFTPEWEAANESGNGDFPEKRASYTIEHSVTTPVFEKVHPESIIHAH